MSGSQNSELTQQTAMPGAGSNSESVTRLIDSNGPRAARPDPFSDPESLGMYRIQRVLGRGGMGVVYLGFDEQLQRPAAVKVITPTLAESELAIERLRTEARAAARLSHPNIVSVYAFGEQQGLNYIVYEFIDGTDVATLIKQNGPLNAARALKIIRESAQALRFAWANHIVHRDIKPANILVMKDGTTKVADFGLAKRLDMDAGLTTSSMVVGSPAYMSPEQGMGHAVDFRSDVYALGCTLYACLTASVPFTAETPLGVMMKHANEKLPEPESIRHLYGGRMMALIRKMMAKRPEERHASYDELIDEIDELIRATEGKKIKPAASVRAEKSKLPLQKIGWVMGGAGVLLFIVFAVIVLMDSRPVQTAPTYNPSQTSSVAAVQSSNQVVASIPQTPPPAVSNYAPPVNISTAGEVLASLGNIQMIRSHLSTGNWQEAQRGLQLALQRPDMPAADRGEVEEFLQTVIRLEQFENQRYAEMSSRLPFDVRIPGTTETFRVESATPTEVRGVSSSGARGDYTRPSIPPIVKNALVIGFHEISPLEKTEDEFVELLYRRVMRDPGVDSFLQSFYESKVSPADRPAYSRLFAQLDKVMGDMEPGLARPRPMMQQRPGQMPPRAR